MLKIQTQRFALGVEYLGTAFCGWQTQSQGGSVQDALERALTMIANQEIHTMCAGRTDAGVHGVNQVVHFDTDVIRPESAWVRGVNSHLPDGMAIRWVRAVPADFHARFSARGRAYRYLLLNRPQRAGLWQGRVGWYHRPLQLDAMQEAASYLLGTHDFSSFRAAECQAKSPIKELRQASVRQVGDLFIFDFEATAFLHHMIRNFVGSLIHVGRGAVPPSWLQELLAKRSRKEAAPTFAPDGLYFMGPSYEAHWQLPNLTHHDVLPGVLF